MIGSAFGAAHIAAAMAALVLGTIVIGATKGTPFHRTIGAGYVAAMLIVNLSALAIYRLTGHVEAFHGLALLSLTLLTRGFVAADPPARLAAGPLSLHGVVLCRPARRHRVGDRHPDRHSIRPDRRSLAGDRGRNCGRAAGDGLRIRAVASPAPQLDAG